MLIERILGMRFRDKENGDGGQSGGAGSAGAGSGAADGAAGAGAASGSGGAAGDDAGKGAAAAGGAAGGGDGGAGKSLMEQIGKGGAAAGGDDGKAGEGDAGKGAQTPEAKALAASEKDTRRPGHVPAKYWDAEKGEVRLEALAKSATTLEKRMRDVGLPPETAEGYKFEVPKELKEAGIDLDPKMSSSFRAKAFELGMTQKQYEGVMAEYFGGMGALADQAGQFGEAKARTALMAHYKTEDAMNAAVGRAYRTAEAYLPEAQLDKLMASAGNIPEIITLLDAVGKEMSEDHGVHPDAILDGESVEHLMRGKVGAEDSPYWNAKDPRHKAVVAKVKAHHEAKAAANRRKAA